ncbi:hypothetical protein JRG49_09560 [Pseudomonas fulva]|uniref:hypothetical protein n=1 Tax=Pseudomonas TaxID=286 RepID=UPI0019D18B54|nr:MULTISPECIES: hypothetical protein [Pseudomonas]MBN6791480.1 hypothetical protein [Pseudomonas fulva]MBN6795703.1 hypothetical protein [Pseudomonas fulva]MBN6857265.1 hypothetical protein [Pseudomonas fulva]MBN6874024.1 hypothetical protein [Pseudomonas fulva]MBN6878461.1 hypothetical protein [Pseudomonas fulva]
MTSESAPDIVHEQFESWHNHATARAVAEGNLIAAKRLQNLKEAMFVVWEESRVQACVRLPAATDGQLWVSEVIAAINAQGLKVTA